MADKNCMYGFDDSSGLIEQDALLDLERQKEAQFNHLF
jgi:hypothetical protein